MWPVGEAILLGRKRARWLSTGILRQRFVLRAAIVGHAWNLLAGYIVGFLTSFGRGSNLTNCVWNGVRGFRPPTRFREDSSLVAANP